MKRILVLNGSPRKNGKTASLVKAFKEGAESAGNEVVEMHIDGMDIRSCKACEACAKNGGTCVQKDDMWQVYDAFETSDVVVFASPMFWCGVSGQLRVVVDRLYAECNKAGLGNPLEKESALIMTARGGYYQQALDYYHIFTDILRWRDLGTVLGAGKEDEAKAVGSSIR